MRRIFLFVFLLFSQTLFSQLPGSINTNFGTNGFLYFNMDTMDATVFDMAYAPGNKIVMVGTFQSRCQTSATNQVAVLRMSTNGVLDNTFGDGGYVRLAGLSHSSYNFEPNAVAVDNSGNIYIAGTRTDVCGNNIGATQGFVAKILSNGTGDETFDNYYGVNFLSFAGNGESSCTDIALNNSGSVFVCGSREVSNTEKGFIGKYSTTTGTGDAGFGTNGVFTHSVSGMHRFSGMQLYGTTMLYVCGYEGTGKNLVAAVSATTGTLNTGFNTTGYNLFDIGAAGDNEYLYDILYDNNKLYVCGYSAGKPAVCRFTLAGALDNTFNTTGKRIETFPETSFNSARSLCEFSNNIYVLSEVGSDAYGKVYALNSTGGIDNTFGSGGYQNVAFGGGIDCTVKKILSTGNGGLIVAGNPQLPINQPPALNNYNYRYQWSIAGLDADDGSPVNYFSGSPYKNIYTNMSNENLSRVALQQGDKIISAITYYNYLNVYGPQTYVRRCFQDGSVDPAFQESNFQYTAIVENYIYPDGRILLLCNENDPSGTQSSIVLYRLKPGGDRDSTFGTNGKVTKTISSMFLYPTSMKVNSNGEIFTCGWENDQTFTTYDIFIMKLNANGSYDANYDGDGYVTHVSPGPLVYGRPSGLILPSGNFALAFWIAQSGGPIYGDLAFAEFAPDGAQVGSNHIAGLQQSSTAYVYDFQPVFFKGTDNRMYVYASYYEDNLISGKFCRIHPDYSFDASFGIGGVKPVVEPVDYIYPADGMLNPDGKPMLLYTRMDTATGEIRRIVVHRMDTTGTDDNAFSFDGKAVVQANAVYANQHLLLPNGMLLVVGTDQMTFGHSDIMWAQVVTEHVLSTGDQPLPVSLDIFPNPSNGSFWTNSTEANVEHVVVQDLNGKSILEFHQDFPLTFELNLGAVPSGVYLVRYETDKGVTTRKLVVQR